MKFTYNVEGTRKKELVNAVSHLLVTDSVYQGPPSFAYKVDGYTIDRYGNLIAPDEATMDDLFRLTDALFAEYGFKPEEDLAELFSEDDEEDDEAVCEPDSDDEDEAEESDPEDEVEDSTEEPEAEAPEEEEPEADDAPENGLETAALTVPEDDIEETGKAPRNGDSAPDEGEETAEDGDAEVTPEAPEAAEETAETGEDEPAEDDNKLTLSLPREKFSDAAIDRLQALVKSKQTLLKKVFETDELTIIVNDAQIMFPWFTLHGINGEVDAYAKFIHAIAMRALTSSRISSTERQTDNDKFTMRLFLNNLGFKGEEYKFARRFLIRNLEGNGAWRYGNKPDASSFDLDMPTVFKPAVNPPTLDELTGEETETESEVESDEDVGNEEEESTDEE